MKNYFLESCVTTLPDALLAERNGADRLEICSRLETEGMTPDLELVSMILEKIKIPVRVMIRETETGYEANAAVLERMIRSIDDFKTLQIDGFVLGILKNDKIDRDAMKKFIDQTTPFPITFHKAIDQSKTKWEDIEWLNEQVLIDTILTSGGATRALDGIDEILKMKNAFKRNIMAAGRILHQDVPALHEKLQLRWYHGRRIVSWRSHINSA